MAGDCASASTDLAAWTQAIGSIVAILAAIGIAWWQRREANRDRAASDIARARSLALTILPSLLNFEKRLKTLLADYEPRPTWWTNSIEDVIPGTILQENVGRLHELGAAAEAVQLVVRSSLACGAACQAQADAYYKRRQQDPEPDDTEALEILKELDARVRAAAKDVVELF